MSILGVFRAGAVEREFDVSGVEIGTVVEFDARVQLERIDLAVFGNRPAFGKIGQDLAIGTDAGQTLEDVGISDLADGGGCTGRRIEMRRLQHHAKHQVGAGGEGCRA